MTDTLRDKLIQKGWVTPFNADTLVRLIEEHYTDGPAVPEGREPAAVITEPSDQELADAYWKAWHGHNGRTLSASHYAGLRAVLARRGNLKESLTSSPPADGEVAEPTREELWELWLRLNNELPDRPAAVAEFWEHARVHTLALIRPRPAAAGGE